VCDAKGVTQARPSVKNPIISLVMWLDQWSINKTAISSANASRTWTSARLDNNTVLISSRKIFALIHGFRFHFKTNSVPNWTPCFLGRFQT
jgi:hypothetical protein